MELGHGNHGRVLLAEDDSSRRVALKIIPKNILRTPDPANEAKIAIDLNHPNLAKVYSAFEFGEFFCIAYELIQGITLEAFLKTERVSEERFFDISDQLLAPITYLHKQRTVHGDIHDGNIIISDPGIPTFTDYGLAQKIKDDALVQRSSRSSYNPQITEVRTPQNDIRNLGGVLEHILNSSACSDKPKIAAVLSRAISSSDSYRYKDINEFVDGFSRIRQKPTPKPVTVIPTQSTVQDTLVTSTDPNSSPNYGSRIKKGVIASLAVAAIAGIIFFSGFLPKTRYDSNGISNTSAPASVQTTSYSQPQTAEYTPTEITTPETLASVVESAETPTMQPASAQRPEPVYAQKAHANENNTKILLEYSNKKTATIFEILGEDVIDRVSCAGISPDKQNVLFAWCGPSSIYTGKGRLFHEWYTADISEGQGHFPLHKLNSAATSRDNMFDYTTARWISSGKIEFIWRKINGDAEDTNDVRTDYYVRDKNDAHSFFLQKK